VVDAALEIALVVLDGSIALDQGRSLGLEQTPLLLGLYEWANALFALLEKGIRIKGEGGTHEVKLRGTVAGVLLKIEEVRSKWGRSMIDTR
jgi:telomere length regulation protein